jgi:hypothetical protein
MKKIFLLLIAVVACHCAYSQTFNPTYAISASGTADSFKGGYTFAYSTSGAPWSGALMSFGGALNNYDCQISTLYGAGGTHISYRTHNGDSGAWNSWFEIWHSGNLNRADADFTARTIRSANIYNNGNLWSKQINVALTNPWPDYVFTKDYRLPSLKEIENYVDQYHHLPEIPSEEEVVKEGINLGEMNRLLIKKVEELTLYLIQKEAQLAVQQKKNDEQDARIGALEKTLKVR